MILSALDAERFSVRNWRPESPRYLCCYFVV